MSYTPQNPYIVLAELVGELRQDAAKVEATATLKDELLRSIDRASRWVDDYTQRDYLLHDHTIIPITLNEFSGGVYDKEIFLPYRPVIEITELAVAGTAWAETTDFIIGTGEREGRIFSRRGNFAPTADAPITIKGRFGYAQPSISQVTEAGDSANQLANWAVAGMNGRTLYWRIDDMGANARVRLALDSAFSSVVAEGTGAKTGTVTVTLATVNSSGISGTVELTYSAADTDSANTLTPIATAIDTTSVPVGLPGRIVTSTRLVAAAFSGLWKRDDVGLDGQKVTITQTEIPKTVYQLLGKRMPVVI